MKRVVFFDDNGEPTSTAVFSRPEDASESGGHDVNDEWSDSYIIERIYIKGGQLRERPERPSDYHEWDAESETWVENMEWFREDTLQTTDQRAEAARSKYITPGSGQTMTYEEKHRQALDGGGPMVTAEAEALGITEQEVIDSVLAARAQWEQVGARIEAARLKAKRDIRQAETSQEIHAAADQLDQALAQL